MIRPVLQVVSIRIAIHGLQMNVVPDIIVFQGCILPCNQYENNCLQFLISSRCNRCVDKLQRTQKPDLKYSKIYYHSYYLLMSKGETFFSDVSIVRRRSNDSPADSRSWHFLIIPIARISARNKSRDVQLRRKTYIKITPYKFYWEKIHNGLIEIKR